MTRHSSPPPPQLLLMERKLQEVHPLLTLCGQIVENWQGNPIQKESLRVFFLVLQVTHYLDAGQVCCRSGSVGRVSSCVSAQTCMQESRSSTVGGSLMLHDGIAPRVEGVHRAVLSILI